MKGIIIASASLVASIGFCAFIAGITLLPRSNAYQSSVIVIAPGSSRGDIAAVLQQHGVIRNAFLFRTATQLMYPSQTMKAGEYELSPSQSFMEIAQLLFRGVPPKEIHITIVEGWTINDMATYLESRGLFTAEDFKKAIDEDYLYDFLPSKNASYQRYRLEGYLYPDTYRIYVKSSPHEVIDKMLTTFQKKVINSYGKEIIARGRSLHEVVTLASIIEKEVQSDVDRARVADLLERRLSSQMPLQVDSTVNYITGKSLPSASYQDIAVDSPYNTYRVRGLPPGPINNPGDSSIRAALYPEANPYLFFLTTPDQKVIYSKTFEEHKINRIRYLTTK